MSAFDAESGVSLSKADTKDYSAVFGDKLISLAEKSEKIIAVTAAMPSGTGLTGFSKKFRSRFFDVGIAEQHAVTMCGGLAINGYSPVFAVYSSFLQRAYDQVLHDICLQNLHVVFGIDRAGIVGADGETHQGLYDMAMLLHMPNMSVLSPSNFRELEEMLDYAVNTHNAPIAVRYPRGGSQSETLPVPFEYGKSAVIREGSDITVICAGRTVGTAKKTADILLEKNISCEIIALRTIKPLDSETIINSVNKTKRFVSIEDGVKTGGFGSMTALMLAENGILCRCGIFGFPDKPVVHGTTEQLDKLYGMDPESISEKIYETLFQADEKNI